MKIHIIDVNKQFVSFSCSSGHGIAIWDGHPPEKMQTYHVEIEISKNFELNQNLFHSIVTTPQIYIEENKIFFNAKYIAYEEDHLLAVKLENNVIFLEAKLGLKTDFDYIKFVVSPDDIKLYPFEL